MPSYRLTQTTCHAPLRYRCHPSGFSLAEVTVAIGILAFVLVVLLGLLPTGITTNQTVAQQAKATNLLSSLKGDLEASRSAGITDSAFYGVSVPAAGFNTYYMTSGGQIAASPGENPDLRITVQRVQEGGLLRPDLVRLQVSWPATDFSADDRFAPNDAGIVASAAVIETAIVALPNVP